MALKTMAQWKGSLNEYLQIGDYVDEPLYNYMLEVVPPACMDFDILQVGEPCADVDGKPTFTTLKRTPSGWMYAGECHFRKDVPPAPIREGLKEPGAKAFRVHIQGGTPFVMEINLAEGDALIRYRPEEGLPYVDSAFTTDEACGVPRFAAELLVEHWASKHGIQECIDRLEEIKDGTA